MHAIGMYIRRTKTKTLNQNHAYTTYRMVESVRLGQKVKQRTLLNLGKEFSIDQAHWPLLCARIEQLLQGSEAVQGEIFDLADELNQTLEAAAQRYYRFFPQSRDYHRAHDFDFWRLEPVRWRFIGGFGAIHWLEQVALANPFAGDVEVDMLEHMNRDHAAAIAHYVELADLPRHAPAELVGIDGEGFHLRIGQALHWLPFPVPCDSPGAVRQALVQLARAAVWPTDGVAAP